MKGFRIKAGWDSPTLNALLVATKLPIPDAILNLDFLTGMSDNNIENREPETDVIKLPLLIRDEQGKLLRPLVPDWTNIAKRIAEDKKIYADGLEKRLETRGALHIESLEAENVGNILEKAGGVIYKSRSGVLPSELDLSNLATYLDWSYQEQVGVPASVSNQEEAVKHGTGALDTWALFTSIKNKLQK